MTQIPASPISGGQTSPASITPKRASTANHGMTAAPEIRGIKADNLRHRVNLLSEWKDIGEQQATITRFRHANLSVNEYGATLSSVAKVMAKGSLPSSLSGSISSLIDTVQQDRILNLNLNEPGNNTGVRYRVESPSLLTPQPQAETLAVLLANGQYASFRVPENTPEPDILKLWQDTLSGAGVKLQAHQGHLIAEGPNEAMASPWAIQGEGVRVGPAHHVELTQQPMLLEELKSQFDNQQSKEAKSTLRTLFQNLERQVKSTEAGLNDATNAAKKNGLFNDPSREDLFSAADKVLQKLNTKDFSKRLEALKAQANVSSDLVISILTR